MEPVRVVRRYVAAAPEGVGGALAPGRALFSRERWKPLVVLLLVMALLATGMSGTVAADDLETPGEVTIEREIPFGSPDWGPDRADVQEWNASGPQLTVEVSDTTTQQYTGSPDPSCFRCTEGRKLPLASGMTRAVVTLEVDPTWDGSVPVRAGLWTHGGPSSSSYGIIEFVTGSDMGAVGNHTTQTGIRFWDTIAGAWDFAEVDVTAGGPFTLEVDLNTEADQYEYFVNGELVGTGPVENTEEELVEVFLNHYNFGGIDRPREPADGYEVAPYTVEWSDLIVSAAFDSIQDAVTAAGPGDTITVGPGTYTGPVTVDKSVDIVGSPGASILQVPANADGFTVTSDDVGIENMTIVGPHEDHYTSHDWSATDVASTTGIRVDQNLLGIELHGNEIRDVRTGMLLLANAAADVRNNVVDNTKGSILLRGDDVDISGNSPGTTGNEWDIVLLNHITEAAYFGSPGGDLAGYGSSMMELSADNGGMTILDRRFGSNGLLEGFEDVGNRSHIVVDPAAPAFTAEDDFDFGNGLGNPRQPLGNLTDGVDAVVHGGVVTVREGTYVGDVTIATPAEFELDGEAQITGGVRITASGTTFSGFDITNPAGGYGVRVDVGDVTVADNTITGIGTSETFTNAAQAIYVRPGAAVDGITISGNDISTVGHANGWSHKGVFLGDSDSDAVIGGVVIDDNTIGGVSAADGKGAYGITTNVGGGTGSGSVPGLQITNNTISDLSGEWARAIALEGPTPDAVVTGNTASGLTAGEYDASGVFFEANPAAGSTLIRHNRFSEMTFGVALHPGQSGAVTARNNWWGTADGPGVVDAFPGSGSIDTEEWCLQAACSSFAAIQDITVGPEGQYDSIQDAVEAAPVGRTIRVFADVYGDPVLVNKALTIIGEPGATVDVPAGQTGITVASDDVVIEGLTIDGEQDVAHYDNTWTESSTGIAVSGNRTGVVLRDNTVRDVRTGIYVHPNAAVEATGNTLENTKGSFILYSHLVTMDDNETGPLGNEWDIVVLLSSNPGAYFGDPAVDEAAYGAEVMDLSAANDGMTVLDRRFGSIGFIGGYEDVGNRSHVLVDAEADFDAGDDFDLGNGLGNPRQPLNNITDAVEAAVLGGVVTVREGAYVGDVTIAEVVSLQTDGNPSIEGEVRITAAGTHLSGFEIANPNGGFGVQIEAADVTVSANHIHDIGTGTTGLAQAIYVDASAADADDVEISDNLITDIGNLATGRSHKAILVGDSTADNVITGLRITGNEISAVEANRSPWAPEGAGGAGAYGIQINVGSNGDGSTPGAVIGDNTISDLSGHWVHAIGLEGPTPNAQVTGNDIADLDASKSEASDDDFDDEVGVFFEDNDGATSTQVTQNAFSGMAYGVATHPDEDIADGAIDARRNYWGSGGPTGMRLGTGDDLTTAFEFSPWLDAPGGNEVFPSGVVSGQVADGTGAGVAGVTVTVSGTGDQPAATGTDGRYSVSRDPGTYTVMMTVPGGSIASGPTERTVIVASGGSASADFVVISTGSISGRVRDVVGSPVSGVTVSLGDGTSTTTGVDGGYQFTDRPTGSDTVSITLPGGYTAGGPISRNVNLASGSSATADFVIARTAAISGRVVDAAGVGRSGVTVSLSGAGSATTTTTGADGSYVFADREAFGVYTVAITLPTDFVAGGPTSRSVNLASGSSATANFAIARRASISGKVVDGTGAGVAGVAVAVTPSGGTPNNVTTDALGRYRAEGLSQFGAYSVTMSVPSGFVANGPTNRAVNLASGSSATADFAVVEVASISGQVVDEAGAPVSGVSVTLSGAGSDSTLTDTAGRYRFADRSQFGTYAITIDLPSGFTPGSATSRTVNLAAGTSASANFRILQEATVAGQVVDDTGAPISGVAVAIDGPDGARAPRVTDAQGRYRLSGQTEFGAYVVKVTPPSGFVAGGATTRTVNLAAGSSATADFRVAAAAAISGVVTDAVGAPLSGVTITITAPGGGDTVRTTDAQGRYRLSSLGTFGTYQVTASVPTGFAAGGATTRSVNLSTGSAASADFVLAQTASIVGQVRDATDAPVSGVTISLGGAGTGSTRTDATGSYRFANRSQFGAYTVTMTVPAGFVVNGQAARTVNLATGQSATASFAVTETGTISGQVADNTLSGVGGVEVELDTGETTTTDAEGRYRFPGLTGNSRTVTIDVPDGFEADGDTVAVAAVGGTFDLVLLPVGTVSGYLFVDLDGDGTRGDGEPPLAGLTVNLMVGGSVNETTTSAADGFYLFEDAPEGATIEVQAGGFSPTSGSVGAASFGGFGRFSTAEFHLASSHGTTAREDVGMLPAGTIAGSTRQSGGDPVAGVAVTLSGAATGSAVSSADGVFMFTGLANNTAGAEYTLTVSPPNGFTLSGATSRNVSLVSVSAATAAFTLAATDASDSDDDDDDDPDVDPDEIDQPVGLTPERPTLTTTPGSARATWRDANGNTRLELDLTGAKRRSGASEPVFDAVRIGNPASPSTAVAALGREGIRSAGIATASEAVRLTLTGVDFEGGAVCPTDLAPGQRIIAFDGANLLGRDITTTVDGRTCGRLEPTEDDDVVIDLLVVDLDEPTFGDVGQTSPHFLAVEALSADSRQILRGARDGDLDAGGLLRRDQAASILSRALGLDLDLTDANGAFPDVASGLTHAAAIAALMELDPPIITGFSDGTFRPGAFITRDQLASIVVRAYRDQLEGPSGSGFPDVPAGSVHADNIDRLINSGAIQGFTDGTFGSGDTIHRAQVASVVARSLYRTTGE